MTRTAEIITNEIRTWDLADVHILRELVAELKVAANGDMDAYVDMSDLPTADLPTDVDVSTYPVWAIDNLGNCLVGDDASDIEPLTTVIENCKTS